MHYTIYGNSSWELILPLVYASSSCSGSADAPIAVSCCRTYSFASAKLGEEAGSAILTRRSRDRRDTPTLPAPPDHSTCNLLVSRAGYHVVAIISWLSCGGYHELGIMTGELETGTTVNSTDLITVICMTTSYNDIHVRDCS